MNAKESMPLLHADAVAGSRPDAESNHCLPLSAHLPAVEFLSFRRHERGGEHAQPAGAAGGVPQRTLVPHLLLRPCAAGAPVSSSIEIGLLAMVGMLGAVLWF